MHAWARGLGRLGRSGWNENLRRTKRDLGPTKKQYNLKIIPWEYYRTEAIAHALSYSNLFGSQTPFSYSTCRMENGPDMVNLRITSRFKVIV